MAKMHSRKKGSSGSKKPLKPSKPSWVRYKAKEVELLITKFAKEGKSSSEIGLLLRDSYGVPSTRVVVGKSVAAVLAEKKLTHEIPDDLLALMHRGLTIQNHMKLNKKDMTALRGFQLTHSKINRLAKYYKNNGRIPKTWKYQPELV
ncbi:MAG: 30S ribosomal protein S15, partial [Candidatus Woesearchaeota archaeon]|nr:30S ribosomal protein S15 [Candidatus Woesearchaeota archaeon]